jgi:hypothetical protein
VAAGGKPKPVDHGRFAGGLSAPTTRTTLADGTYVPTLPYASPQDGDDPEVGAEQAQGPRLPLSDEGSGGGTPSLAYVAAALEAAVVAAHVLWLRAQVLRPDAAAVAAPGGEVLPADG